MFVRICPLTQADLTNITVAKLQARLKATTSVTDKTLKNTLRNRFQVKAKSNGVLNLSKEYAEVAVAQAQSDDEWSASSSTPKSSRGGEKRTYSASSQEASSSSKRARRAPSESMDSVESSSDEDNASFADSSFASPTPPCPPPRSTPAMNHAADSRQKLTPQSRSSVYVNVASTGLRRVQGRPSADPSSGGRGYSSVSPFSEVAVASPAPSPSLPNRLDFSAGDGGQPAAAVRTKTVSTMEIVIVLAGALAAICMTAFVDSGMGIQLYSAPASPQLDSIPNTVRSLSPEIFGALEWSCRSLRPIRDAKSLAALLNVTGVTEKDVSDVLNYHVKKGTMVEYKAGGGSSSRFSLVNACEVSLLCRLFRFLWLAIPLLAALVDLALRWKLLANSRLFAAEILEELRHAAELDRSLAAVRLKAELVERLGVTGTRASIGSAWRRAEATAFTDKRLHKFAKVDGGEQTEMWQYKSGTTRNIVGLTGGSRSSPLSNRMGMLLDGIALVPRVASYLALITISYTVFVQ